MLILIDNYDSFTYNLYHYLVELEENVVVKRNDAITVEELHALNPSAFVISPGPCSPSESGICLELIDSFAGTLPILGVCLGCQAIGQVFGANIVRAQAPVHGKTSMIKHSTSELFKNVPQEFRVVRYHSLIIERETLPHNIKITAETSSNEIMAIEHINYPIFGVQFHPESIQSEFGKTILQNFLHIKESIKTNNIIA